MSWIIHFLILAFGTYRASNDVGTGRVTRSRKHYLVIDSFTLIELTLGKILSLRISTSAASCKSKSSPSLGGTIAWIQPAKQDSSPDLDRTSTESGRACSCPAVQHNKLSRYTLRFHATICSLLNISQSNHNFLTILTIWSEKCRLSHGIQRSG